ncbi:MAG TPA: type II secretion system minor pseudopilin GspI [Steroidobacteraceae bacterium]|nr:type II secretion system minor pseudopilin GspI [Steroidobacteraceae bacterium]
MSPAPQRGFTLIEVLVALAIVAIGMAAVLEALTSSANTAVYLQDKTFAEWVALNRLETVRLSGNMPGTGTSNDKTVYAGRSWEWQQKVSPLPGMAQITDVREIEIDVRPADSTAGDNRGWYASVTGFMSANLFAPPQSPGPAWTPPGTGTPGGQPQPNGMPPPGASSTQ